MGRRPNGDTAMSAAQRMRRHRQRRKAGRLPLLIDVDDVAWAQKLIALGRLDPAAEDDAQAIAAATADFLDGIGCAVSGRGARSAG